MSTMTTSGNSIKGMRDIEKIVSLSETIASLNEENVVMGDELSILDSELLNSVLEEDDVYLVVIDESELGLRSPTSFIDGLIEYREFGSGRFSSSENSTVILAVQRGGETDLYFSSQKKAVAHNLILELGTSTELETGVFIFENLKTINEVINKKVPPYKKNEIDYLEASQGTSVDLGELNNLPTISSASSGVLLIAFFAAVIRRGLGGVKRWIQ